MHRFTAALNSQTDLIEGAVAHFETKIEPAQDPRMRIEWLHNGQPIAHSARMKNIYDFGYVIMELSPAEPQDTGTWTCRATNDHGDAEISCEVAVEGISCFLDFAFLTIFKIRRLHHVVDFLPTFVFACSLCIHSHIFHKHVKLY